MATLRKKLESEKNGVEYIQTQEPYKLLSF